MKPYEVSPGYMGLPRLFTTFSDDTPDVKRFAQVRSYQCSHLRADAHVGGPNLLTSEGIYHICCPRQSSDPFLVPYPIIPFSRCGRRRCLVEAECTVSGGYAKIPSVEVIGKPLSKVGEKAKVVTFPALVTTRVVSRNPTLRAEEITRVSIEWNCNIEIPGCSITLADIEVNSSRSLVGRLARKRAMGTTPFPQTYT